MTMLMAARLFAFYVCMCVLVCDMQCVHVMCACGVCMCVCGMVCACVWQVSLMMTTEIYKNLVMM